jgi:2-polyprenyl-6-methoxyphenol hydroxylase-like FAD-dependent oxidoreductase
VSPGAIDGRATLRADVAAPGPVFDVIIVGGRPAGASLACRLAQRGLTVLIVDKASFPSHPEVPCCPIMYSSAVELLDEIGFDESKYAAVATRVHKGVVGFEHYFQVTIQVPMTRGRDYLYGFDRAAFDAALWDHLRSFPAITARAGFVVGDLLRDPSGRVCGIEGGVRGQAREQVRARLAVVGADGRHSLVARKAGAAIAEQQGQHTSTIHFAEWDGVAPVSDDGEPALHIVSTGRGKNVLFFPSRDGRVSVATHVRADRAQIAGDAEAYYAAQLRGLPSVERRLARARRAGPLLGVRRIANRYREVGGPGWILVGDALHHKDPIDGQGICDALVSARELAALLGELHDGLIPWQALLARYQKRVMDETYSRYQSAMKRLARDLYSDPPPWLIRTVVRWTLEDPEYQRRFLLFLTRSIAPSEFRTPRLMLAILARGASKDLLRLIRPGAPRPVR